MHYWITYTILLAWFASFYTIGYLLCRGVG